MITGNEFIQLANRWSVLQPPHGSEEVWRTAIGRAYYGAFHLAQQFLKNIGIQFPKSKDQRSVHMFVADALHNSNDPDLELASQLLADLRDYRNDADYDLTASENGDQALAIQCLSEAYDIRTRIQNCHPANYPAVKSAINHWCRINKI